MPMSLNRFSRSSGEPRPGPSTRSIIAAKDFRDGRPFPIAIVPAVRRWGSTAHADYTVR